MKPYEEFLRAKIKMASFKGFQVKPEACHPILFPHQRDIVRWSVLGGNRAIFASFGLGKSVMQCEWLRQVIGAAGGLGLIVCPLGVRQELIRDAAMLGIELRFIRSAAEIQDGHAFYCTNYETVRDGKLDPQLFTAVSLDEATRKASFAQQLPQHRSERAQAVREGTKAGMQARRSGKASSVPQRTAKPPPKAVDPQALQPTATVSDPAGLLQKPECVRFLTRFERLAAEKAPPLPPDPPSSWAQAVIQNRRLEAAP